MSEQHGNEEESKRQAVSGSQSEREREQQPAHDGAQASASERKAADGWDGVNDGIDRAEADVSQMMDDLEYIRAKVRVLRGRYG